MCWIDSFLFWNFVEPLLLHRCKSGHGRSCRPETIHDSAWKIVRRVLRCHTLQEIYLNLSGQIRELPQRFALTSSVQFANLLLRFCCIFACSFCSALLSLIPCYPLACANILRLLHGYVQTRSSNYACNLQQYSPLGITPAHFAKSLALDLDVFAAIFC